MSRSSTSTPRAGATRIDGTLRRLGAGAGNSPTEVLAVAFERLDIETGVDVNALMYAAEEVLRPMITRMPIMDRASIMQGKIGVYNSFLLHAERYGVAAHDVLAEVSRRGYVGGQENMIIDVAVWLQGQTR